jgi:hypothetical protein
MMGCFVARKCFVACRLGDSSQQPTWPHSRQRRRWTHQDPVSRHSSQPAALGLTSRMVSRWVQPVIEWILGAIAEREIASRMRASERPELQKPVMAWLNRSGTSCSPAAMSVRRSRCWAEQDDEGRPVRIALLFDKSVVNQPHRFLRTKAVASTLSMTSDPTNPAGDATPVRGNLVPHHVSGRDVLTRTRTCAGMRK